MQAHAHTQAHLQAHALTMMICRCCATNNSRGRAKCCLGGPLCSASSKRFAPRAHVFLLLSVSRISTSDARASPPREPSSCSHTYMMVCELLVLFCMDVCCLCVTNQHANSIQKSRHTQPHTCSSDMSEVMLIPVSVSTRSFNTSRSKLSAARKALARNWHSAAMSTSGYLHCVIRACESSTQMRTNFEYMKSICIKLNCA